MMLRYQNFLASVKKIKIFKAKIIPEQRQKENRN